MTKLIEEESGSKIPLEFNVELFQQGNEFHVLRFERNSDFIEFFIPVYAMIFFTEENNNIDDNVTLSNILLEKWRL